MYDYFIRSFYMNNLNINGRFQDSSPLEIAELSKYMINKNAHAYRTLLCSRQKKTSKLHLDVKAHSLDMLKYAYAYFLSLN
jgi:hypothetical protein